MLVWAALTGDARERLRTAFRDVLLRLRGEGEVCLASDALAAP